MLEKPSNVTTAVNVLYFSFGIGLARVLLDVWFGELSVKPADWVILLILGPVFCWIYYMTGKGRNWARNVVLILTLATVPLSIPVIIKTLGDNSLSIPLLVGLTFLDVVGVIFSVTALVFLFQQDAVAWFKAMNGPGCTIPEIERPEDEQVSYVIDTRERQPTRNDLSILDAVNEIVAALSELTVNKLRPSNLFQSLRNTDQPILSYVWRAWLIAFIPSLVVGAIAASSFALLGYKDPQPDFSSLSELVVVAVLVAPWLETLIMWPVLAVLKLILRRTLLVALASGVIFGALHVVGGPHLSQGVATTWSFLILSLCFLEWYKKSKWRAIVVTALVHTLHNGLVFGVVMIAILSGAENPVIKRISPSPSGQQKEASVRAGTEKTSPEPSVSSAPVKKSVELSLDEMQQTFQSAFPDCRQQEFELAHEDLYPDWKKNLAPNGTWDEFLSIYKEFVQWWEDRGSPAEPGLKLWKDYWSTKR
jgi:hypothetical protein